MIAITTDLPYILRSKNHYCKIGTTMKHFYFLIMLNLLCFDVYSMNPPGVQIAPAANNQIQQHNNRARCWKFVTYGTIGCFLTLITIGIAVPLVIEESLKFQGPYYRYSCKRIASIRFDNESIAYPQDATPICLRDPNRAVQEQFNSTRVSIQSLQEECFNRDSYTCIQPVMLSTPCGNTTCNYTTCNDQGNPCTNNMQYLLSFIQNSFSQLTPSAVEKNTVLAHDRSIKALLNRTRQPQKQQMRATTKKGKFNKRHY